MQEDGLTQRVHKAPRIVRILVQFLTFCKGRSSPAAVKRQATQAFTLNDVVGHFGRSLREGLRYFVLRKGFLTMGASYAAGFLATDPDTARPDVQVGLVLCSADKFGDGLHRFPGFTILVRLLRPESRGTVLIGSPDPLQAPVIRPNYFSMRRIGRFWWRG